MDTVQKLLDVSDLTVDYRVADQRMLAVDRVSFSVGQAEIVGVVGESGSGKSSVALSILQLLPTNARVRGGSVCFNGCELVGLKEDALRRVRGRQIAMIFQDPLSTLNPTFTVGTQLVDIQAAHLRLDRRQLRRRAAELLGRVGIPDAEDRLNRYPHQFSGGMRQRIVIAMALALAPRLLIADEPTSALDVSLQAQILELIAQLRNEIGTAVVFVSHDISAVARLCDRVIVMYAGQVVEQGPVQDVLRAPKHPYTKALLSAMPRRAYKGGRLPTIPGHVPTIHELASRCTFADRCESCRPICRRKEPTIIQAGNQLVHCHMYDARVAREGDWTRTGRALNA